MVLSSFLHCSLWHSGTLLSSPLFLSLLFYTLIISWKKEGIVKGSSGADAMHNNRKHTFSLSGSTLAPKQKKRLIWYAAEENGFVFFVFLLPFLLLLLLALQHRWKCTEVTLPSYELHRSDKRGEVAAGESDWLLDECQALSENLIGSYLGEGFDCGYYL